MTGNMHRLLIFSLLLFVFSAKAQDVQPKEYKTGKGGTITLPMGDLSFADTVISYEVGDPAPMNDNANPKDALGVPDWDGSENVGFVSLGCGGSLVLKFTNNALVNIDGPDLYVFEVGKFVEPTVLSISKDGKHWIEVGRIEGGVSQVDIGDSVKTGEKFNYVKLTDMKSACDGLWPGADIDAVAAIGSGSQFNLNSAVLFATGAWVLKPEARNELNKMLAKMNAYPGVQVIVEGHSDNTGTEAFNQTLSEKRAKAVSDYFENALKGKKHKLSYYGYGSRYPIAGNDTKQGQEKNRRVELVVLPLK
jgi:OOP family OmpA-OmpF porin